MKKITAPIIATIITSLFLMPLPSFAAAPPWQVMKEKLQYPKVGAHQGYIWGFYHNTMMAFERAKSEGADIVELDLRASRDGVAVVYHDETLEDWTKCKGKVSDHTLAELKNCSFYNNQEQIPTFAEVLEWAQGQIIINAEFKDQASIAPALNDLKKYQAHNWVYFQTQQSKQKYELARYLDAEVVLLYVLRNQEDLDWFLGRNDPALLIAELNNDSRYPDWIQKLHAAGKLTSEDSFNHSKLKELFGATCTDVFNFGIDIAITNRTESCVEQAQKYLY